MCAAYPECKLADCSDGHELEDSFTFARKDDRVPRNVGWCGVCCVHCTLSCYMRSRVFYFLRLFCNFLPSPPSTAATTTTPRPDQSSREEAGQPYSTIQARISDGKKKRWGKGTAENNEDTHHRLAGIPTNTFNLAVCRPALRPTDPNPIPVLQNISGAFLATRNFTRFTLLHHGKSCRPVCI